jgi:hypothetical protein
MDRCLGTDSISIARGENEDGEVNRKECPEGSDLDLMVMFVCMKT